ncbi:MAG: amidohydrolase [Bacteroidales bacterium]|nr:amidohydrolase [Bacteroidales bacterium]
MKEKADLIIKNATIYTVDNTFTMARTLVVGNGKILAVGGDELAQKYTASQVIDANGAYVYPGFYDAHCHFLSYGLSKLQRADLVGTKSFDEVLERVAAHAAKSDAGWIEGRGWDQNDWEVKAFPDRKKLDVLFPDRPVNLTRIDGHAALVNGEALRRAGITADTKVVGGEVLLIDGEPSGILIDNAIELVSEQIPENSPELQSAALIKAQEDCFRVGLTSVMDAGLPVSDIMIIDSLQKQGEMKMRINAMLTPMDSNYLNFMKRGHYRTDRLHVNSVKLYADGALGSRGACMIEPYSDDAGNHGLIMYPEAYYREVIEHAIEYDFQVNTHAIGDSGNRFILDLYAEYLQGPNDRRWRVEHAQILHPDDFEKFGAYNIIPSVQSTHCTSDMYWAVDRVGPERIKGAYAWQKLLEQNGWLPNGTDFPIEDISPLKTYYAAVSRKDLEGYPEGGFQPEEGLDREEALRSITIWAAKGAFEENEKGSLEVGKLADLVILDKDIMNIPEAEIPGAKVLYTIVNGETVFDGR